MENKKAISRANKFIVGLQLFFVIGVVVFLYAFAPHLNYPPDGAVFDGEGVQFGLRNANVILVDDDPEFNSPVRINVNEIEDGGVLFEAGTYYWKAEGVLESSGRSFTINSNVGLELDEEKSSLKNVGNIQVNVTEERNESEEGLAILDVGVEYPVETENGTVYKGVQHD